MLKILNAGVALFAMLFGAGNVIFPIALGAETGNKIGWALLGFCITAIFVPLLGLVSISAYDSDYEKFLGRLGKISKFISISVLISLIGPVGAIPRCINVSYSALNYYIPKVTLLNFSIFSGLLLFLESNRKEMINLIGKLLGPLKITFLLSIIFAGIYLAEFSLEHSPLSKRQALIYGGGEGYATMDLLGVIFFARLVLPNISENDNRKFKIPRLMLESLKIGLVSAILLAAVYAGFCLIAALHTKNIEIINRYKILSSLAPYLLGKYGGLIVNTTIALSCLVTALGLTTVFAKILQKNKIISNLSNTAALLYTIVLSCTLTNLGLEKLTKIIIYTANIFYPALIVLSICNILFKLINFRFVKLPVMLTILITITLIAK